jgi:hypothetical protein
LEKICRMWASTVLELRKSRAQMPRLEWPLRHERQHLPLSVRESGQRPGAPAVHQPGHDRRVDDAFTFRDAVERVGQHRDVRHPLLQQVSDALGVLLDEPRGVPHLEVLRQHEHADVGMGAADAVGGHQPFVRLRRWHPDVHDRGVGVRGLDVSEQLVGILGLADDLKAGVGEQTRHTVAQERGVVGNHYAHGISTRITVPVSPSRWM